MKTIKEIADESKIKLPLDWHFYPERKGHKTSTDDCFYCGLNNTKVEAGGIWYCPNPMCLGPGAHWFRIKLKSYVESSNDKHTIDLDELQAEALKYISSLEEPFQKENKKLSICPTCHGTGYDPTK